MGDNSGPVRREIKVSGPGVSIEVDFSVSKNDAFKGVGAPQKPHEKHQGLLGKLQHGVKKAGRNAMPKLQNMFKRMARIKHKMLNRAKRKWRGMRKWMKGKRGKGRRGWWKRKAQFLKLWYRKALLAHCEEAQMLCPTNTSPKKITKCLKRHRTSLSTGCSSFLSKVAEFKKVKRANKKEFRAAMKECRKAHEKKHPRKLCFRRAWKARKKKMRSLRSSFRTSLNQDSGMSLQKTEATVLKSVTKAEKFFEGKMQALQSMIGIGAEEFASAAAGCKSDEDCHAGGDMGGYCKANKDCHCTAPFFASNGKGGCELSCSPTCATPCCRDDDDCQKDGDKDAYCKSPKATPHTVPGNGMCRCGTGYVGKYSCKKGDEPMEAPLVDSEVSYDLLAENERCANYKVDGSWTRTWTETGKGSGGLQKCAEECAKNKCESFSFSSSGPEAGTCLYNTHGCKPETWSGYKRYKPVAAVKHMAAESTPRWITGDVEAPKGEKDMGGWTMRVYTPEQQFRLGVDEKGTPLDEPKPKTEPAEAAHTMHRHWRKIKTPALVVASIGTSLGGVLLALLILKKKREAANAVELSAVFDELKGAQKGSEDQV